MKTIITLSALVFGVSFIAVSFGPDYVEQASFKRMQGEHLSVFERLAIEAIK